MMTFALVGFGGLIGASSRYAVGRWVNDMAGNPAFPYGTLAVNVIGCLLIGVLAGLAATRNIIGVDTRAFLIVGLLGGFTTYSAFGLETVELIRRGDFFVSLSNVALQITLGLAAVWAGLKIADSV
ncbi:MAG: fluoride efflux transporter CrcB [SAR202 cluster bacterium]|mgnify:CR=1 FL=1|jgi:CrcB protein|nr:fluoride efflux transporter CrcB [SAR202 cluster bacterium]